MIRSSRWVAEINQHLRRVAVAGAEEFPPAGDSAYYCIENSSG